MNDYDRQEDQAALHEPVFDVDEQIYWEENLEYGLEECVWLCWPVFCT